MPTSEEYGHHVTQCCETRSGSALQSPFEDCIGTFGRYKKQPFRRPADGKVNGYIKFSWPKEMRGSQSTKRRSSSTSDATRVVEIDGSTEKEAVAPHSSVTVNVASAPSLRSTDDAFEFTIDVSNVSTLFSHPTFINQVSATLTPSPVVSNASTEVACIGAPKLLPSQYGYEAKMDDTDRRFWMFCKCNRPQKLQYAKILRLNISQIFEIGVQAGVYYTGRTCG
jgi:hypothetical protein